MGYTRPRMVYCLRDEDELTELPEEPAGEISDR